MGRVLVGWMMVFLAACASPPEELTTQTTTLEGTARLASVFRDYSVGTTRPGGAPCAADLSSANVQYVETLEYIDAPSVTFGMVGECIAEIRTDYVIQGGRFEHALNFVSQRLGDPVGEHRVTCVDPAEEIHAVYWDTPNGRFLVVRFGLAGQPEFVMRPSNAPLTFSKLCPGGLAGD